MTTTPEQKLKALWHRSIFDDVECATLQDYADRVRARLMIAYGRQPVDDSIGNLVALLEELKIIADWDDDEEETGGRDSYDAATDRCYD